MKKKTQEQFLEDCKRVHGNKYDYSLAQYVDSHTKLKIICAEHGVFEQWPSNHINSKRGCPVCANIQTTSHTRKDLSYHLPDIIKIHGNKYDFTDFVYINSKTKSTVSCSCGEKFDANVEKLKAGRGCPHCAKSGFKPNKPCYLYVLKIGDNALKCGITVNLVDRVSKLKRKSNLTITPLYNVLFDNSIKAKQLEDIIKNSFEGCFVDKSLVSDGHTETFSDEILCDVMRIVCNFSSENGGKFSHW